MQLHGGIGVTDEYIGSHYFKRLTQLEMTFGDTLHHLGEVSRAHAGHGRRVRLSDVAPAAACLRPDRRRRPRGRPLHRHAPADRLHRGPRARRRGRRRRRARRRARARARPSCSRRSTRSTRCTPSLLAGGSAFGLDAAGGVMRWLDERGIGVPIGASAPAAPATRADRAGGDPVRPVGRRRARSGPMPPPATPPATRRRATRRPRATSAPAPARRSASCSASSAR